MRPDLFSPVRKPSWSALTERTPTTALVDKATDPIVAIRLTEHQLST